jgi:hypothetical protein
VRISVPSHYRNRLSWGSVLDAGPKISESRLGVILLLDTLPHLDTSSLNLKILPARYSHDALGAQVGNPILARVTLTGKSGNRYKFRTECLGSSGEILTDGRAIALIQGGNKD